MYEKYYVPDGNQDLASLIAKDKSFIFSVTSDCRIVPMYSKNNEVPREEDLQSRNREIFTYEHLMGSFQWAFVIHDKCNLKSTAKKNVSLLYKDCCFYEFP